MTTDIYGKSKVKLLLGGLNLGTGTLKACLLSSAYTQDLAVNEFYSDVSTYLLGTPQTLTGVTTTGGVFNADNVTFLSVASGATVKAVVIYKDTGTGSTSPLLAFLDNMTGLPVTTNGGNINITWDTGANKIFAL